MDDLISRQKALKFTVSHGINIGAKIYVPLGDVTEYLRDLPSAQTEQIARDIATIIENEQDMRVMLSQPEPLTDKEQRTFLRAMEREEKVCKHVDNVYNNSYEDSLVRTCHEITRKVKGALWT